MDYSSIYTTYRAIKPLLRVVLLMVFLISSVSFTLTWTSVISLLAFIITYIISYMVPLKKRNYAGPRISYKVFDFLNPYKGRTYKKYDPVDRERFHVALQDYALYDASQTKSVDNFAHLKQHSECVFARKAKLWGSPDYDETITLEENIQRIYPVFLNFTLSFESSGLDGFIIELPGHLYGTDIKTFTYAVKRTLVTLKNCDNVRKCNKMKRMQMSSTLPVIKEETKTWKSKYWVFEINVTTFFVTSFAPFYPETNSRYNFGLPDCYILFQPEISFAIHDLPIDTPVTNWIYPVTVRDKIRKAFYDSGREYIPPMVTEHPMVYEIVKTVEPDDDQILWWMEDSESSTKDHRKQE